VEEDTINKKRRMSAAVLLNNMLTVNVISELRISEIVAVSWSPLIK
jgi:hypothetical protein